MFELIIRTIKNVPRTEFSHRFVQGMYDRMAMSFYKYGSVTEAYPHKLDAIATLETKVKAYRESGNTEWLMDVANYALIEFMRPRHPDAHFRPTDSAESSGRVWNGGLQSDKPNVEKRSYAHDGD